MQERLHEIRTDLVDLIQLLMHLGCQRRSVVVLFTQLQRLINKQGHLLYAAKDLVILTICCG